MNLAMMGMQTQRNMNFCESNVCAMRILAKKIMRSPKFFVLLRRKD